MEDIELSDGFIVIWRKIMESAIYSDSVLLHLAIHLILKANHKDKEFIFNGEKTIVKRGELITGRKVLSKELKVPAGTIYDKLKILAGLYFLNIKPNNKFSLISIVNYSQYQDKKNNKPNNKPTSSQHLANTNNNDNNDNNDNNIIYKESMKPEKIKHLDFVYLTAIEYNKLINIYGKDIVIKQIEALNVGIGSKGYKYKSHYYTILNWTRRAMEEGKIKLPPPKPMTDEERYMKIREINLKEKEALINVNKQ